MSKPTGVTDEQFAAFLDRKTVDVEQTRSSTLTKYTQLLIAAVITGIAVASFTAPTVVAASIAGERVIEWWESHPEEIRLDQALPQHTVLLDKDGVEFARFLSEDRVDVKREQISDTFVDALIASEDRDFYEHPGIAVDSIIRAALSNAAGNDRQGASTITQQYIQNLLISNARDETEQLVATGTSIPAKIQEARYALWVEKQLSKDEILTGYANAVYFGNGAYGVESAARTYFSTSASELTVPQSALLIALLKAPSAYDPVTNPDSALKRRNVVINSMVEFGSITAEEGEAAKATELGLAIGARVSGCGASAYPHFCALVQQELLTDEAFGTTDKDRQETLRRGGLTITTTLDRTAADIAQTAALTALGADNRVGTGIAVVEPGTGHIAAVAQNHGWSTTQIVYANSQFQPGSVMKPVALAASLAAGFDINTRFGSNGPYSPPGFDAPPGGINNSGKARPGTIDAASAVRQSINIYFIKMAERTGVQAIADAARDMGLTSLPKDWSGREISIAIGTYEVSPLEIATAYATFAAGGVHCDPTTIAAVTVTGTGAPAPAPEALCTQVISNGVAQQMNTILQGPFTRGGTLSAVGGIPGHTAGGKTGTTDGSGAVWTAGMTPQLATAVWVGDPRGGQAHPLVNVTAYGSTIGTAYGASIAGPIWRESMIGSHQNLPAVPFGATGQVGFPADGKQRVPNTVGLELDAAVRTLADAGFAITVDSSTGGDRRYGPGTVTAQSIPAGSAIPGEPTITLILSHGSDTDVDIDPDR